MENFSIDQANGNNNSLRTLAQAGSQGRLDEAKEAKDASKPESIEDRVEITPNALKQTEASDRSRGTMLQPKTFWEDKLAEKTYGQGDGEAKSVTEDRREQEKAVKEGFQQGSVQIQPVVSNQVEAPSPTEQRAEVSKALKISY